MSDVKFCRICKTSYVDPVACPVCEMQCEDDIRTHKKALRAAGIKILTFKAWEPLKYVSCCIDDGSLKGEQAKQELTKALRAAQKASEECIAASERRKKEEQESQAKVNAMRDLLRS